MNRKTLEALQGSIRKWEAIVDGSGIDQGEINCPLCRVFNTATGCDGCPVFEKTAKHFCADSPYDRYCDHPTKRNAQAELNFLRKLLPAGHAP